MAMQGQKSVTVVIPVFNRSELIVRCLDSVRAQTFRPLRVIVVDNNSSDNTAEIVQNWIRENSDPSFQIDFLSEATPGASAARNAGLAKVSSQYTLFFDSDDVMSPNLISEAVNAIGDADLVYWKANVITLAGTVFPKPFHTDNLILRTIFNSQLSTQQYMARTDLFRKIGGWNEKARVWNDWELGMRIGLSDVKATPLPKNLVTIYAQENSITGKGFHDKKGEWERTLSIVNKDIEEADISPEEKIKLKRALAYRKAVLASQYAQEGYKEDAYKLLKEACTNLTPFQSILLRLLYHYLRHGGRGAYYLWLPLVK